MMSKSKIEFISNKAFNMSKRVKCFFTALSSIEDWYVKIKKYLKTGMLNIKEFYKKYKKQVLVCFFLNPSDIISTSKK